MRVDRGRGLLGRLALVAVVLAVAGGSIWLLTVMFAPDEGPIADIPALQVQPAQVHDQRHEPEERSVVRRRGPSP